jgi:hypothetical protein
MNRKYRFDLREGADFRVQREHWLPDKLGVECIAFGKALYVRRRDGAILRHEFLHLVRFRTCGAPRVVLH